MPEDASFLDRDEKIFLLERLKEDDNNSAEETPLMIMEILKIASSWKVVLAILCYFASTISAAAVSAFQPTILKTMGYTASEAQVHTIPVYMTALVFTLVTPWLSDRRMSCPLIAPSYPANFPARLRLNTTS